MFIHVYTKGWHYLVYHYLTSSTIIICHFKKMENVHLTSSYSIYIYILVISSVPL
jgi:hypothetical protein